MVFKTGWIDGSFGGQKSNSHWVRINPAAKFSTCVGEAVSQSPSDLDLSAGYGSECGWIEFPFSFLDAFVEGCGGIGIQNRNGSLSNNRAGINTLVHKMDGTTGYFDSVVQCLFPA
jgi:hypothetical protein